VDLFAERRAEAVRILTEVAGPPALVNGGGTGSLESTREEAAVTEVTAGSGLYSSGLFDYYDTFRHQPAAGFALAVTRCPAPGIWTCHGGGYIASGAAGIDKQPTPWWPPGARLLPAEGAGEVQTPIAYAGPEPLGIGDPVLMRRPALPRRGQGVFVGAWAIKEVRRNRPRRAFGPGASTNTAGRPLVDWPSRTYPPEMSS